MPKGLLAIPGVYRGFDDRRVLDALVLSHPDWNSSYFAGIERLPLGHLLRATPDRVEVRSYWHPAYLKPIRYRRDEDYVEALLEIFDQATAARLRTPRGVGAQLSAGLDSSSVMATAAGILLPAGQAPHGVYLGAPRRFPGPRHPRASAPRRTRSRGRRRPVSQRRPRTY